MKYDNEEYIKLAKSMFRTLGNNAFWCINKHLTYLLGCTETIILQDFIEKARYLYNLSEEDFERKIRYEVGKDTTDKKDVKDLIRQGWFYHTQSSMEKSMGLERRAISGHIETLLYHDVVELKKAGNPLKNYYRINVKEIDKLIKTDLPSLEILSIQRKEINEWKRKRLEDGKKIEDFYREDSINPDVEEPTSGCDNLAGQQNQQKQINPDVDSSTSGSRFSDDSKNYKYRTKNKVVVKEEYPASQSIQHLTTLPTEQPSAESSIKTTKTFKRVSIDINVNPSTPCKLNTPCKEDNTPLEGKTFSRPSKDELDFSKCDDKSSCKSNGPRRARIEFNTPIKDEIDEIISFWKLKKLNFLTEEDYNLCRKIIKDIMNGTFFNNKPGLNGQYSGKFYSKEQIVQTIDNFAKAAFDINYHPTNQTTKRSMAKIKMQDFFYNEIAHKINRTIKYPIPLSNFIKYIENPPKLIPQGNIRLMDDEFPNLTEQIKKYYIDMVNNKMQCKFSTKDENCFVLSAKKLDEFIKMNERNIDPGFFSSGSAKWAQTLINALLYSVDEGVQVSPAWLCTDKMFSERLISYMSEKNMIRLECYRRSS